MATKKENKRHVVRRVRRALNLAETPPMHTAGKLIRSGYGTGAGLKQIDAKDAHDIYDYDWMFYFGYDYCCDCCYHCPLHVDAEGGEGWTFEADNDNDPPKLGELLAV